MTIIKGALIEQAIGYAANPGKTPGDERLLALIEATLRDALGQKHRVWRWRVPTMMEVRQGKQCTSCGVVLMAEEIEYLGAICFDCRRTTGSTPTRINRR